MAVKIQWYGVAELQKTLAAVGAKLDDKDSDVKDVMLTPCAAAMDRARGLAPMRTGKLRASLYATKGPANQRGILMGSKGRVAPYAFFVEFGTSKMPPRPFFRPAIIALTSTFVGDISPGIKTIVEGTASANAYHPPE